MIASRSPAYVIPRSFNYPLSTDRVSPDSGERVPQLGFCIGSTEWTKKGIAMTLARRIAIAVGSLLTVAVAGGAHWRG